jgi:hypothetical protein
MSGAGRARPASIAPEGLSSIVDAWCAIDHTHTVLPADHDVVDATRALRTLIVASIQREPAVDDRDLLHAFGALGRMIAHGDGSPTLAAASLDGLLEALARNDATAYASAARAAMVESYVHARLASVRAEAMRAWDYPACVVPMEKGCIAIAAGYPEGDDALEEWAARVAQGAALSGVRRGVVAGSERAVEAIAGAFAVAGIELVERYVGPVTQASRAARGSAR